MNFKLILLLSLFGLVIGITNTFFLQAVTILPLFWILAFTVSPYIIAKKLNSDYFNNAMLLGALYWVWIGGLNLIFFKYYNASNYEAMEYSGSVMHENAPHFFMVIFDMFYAFASSMGIGLLTLLATKLVKKTKANQHEF